MLLSRKQQFEALFPEAPAFRWRQIEEAFFDISLKSVTEISNIPLTMREILVKELPWLTVKEVRVFESVKKDTFKAVVEIEGGHRVETVLMKNARGQWTVCVSSQVGCAMACTFCATGTMGFTRNLISDEIVDQIRFWNIFLASRPNLAPRISNVVFMGMGEPLANYDNVKEAIRQLLTYTDLGPTHITVSTVGLLPMLRKILTDEKWPPVRLAVSLHSAVTETRKKMMPSSFETFLDELIVWTHEYFAKNETRRRHLTFEYVMLSKINDTEEHATSLIRFAKQMENVKINLIPYNFTGSVYRDSLPGDFDRFQKQLEDAGVTVTRRKTMGDDIAAACGQLIVEGNTTTK
ncbi:MAG: 23S rRNA (adenine(2503)-C(2))-methyltransferase RlmN [Candidatus Moranbacteria bacterium]|nr:23S rRNA (adenine(2503)-C(2))-methyltransferase RlmN [Candidatus Moranbacteria bacterium]MDD3964783.1 23S rRNA (adenine(2503)-C(2))-methyltransferase RlmN [Candidatus Moranbacteria bacterium]